jgi:lysophospholipase L1-like esterase
MVKRNSARLAFSTNNNNFNCFVPARSWTTNGNDTIMMKRWVMGTAIGAEEFAQLQLSTPELSSDALPSHHIIASIPIAFISRVIPVLFSALSYLVTSMTNLVVPIASQIQRLGEPLLTACVILSIIQASIALYQYRYDVRGQLPYPDGLTLGVEQYRDCEKDISSEQADKYSNNNETANEFDDILSEINEEPSKTMPQLMKKMNKALILLLPWITQNVHMLLTRNAHLFHIGIIFTLASFLEDMMKNDKGDVDEYNSPTFFQKVNDDSFNKKDPLRVLVIGDSLSIGIGCIERFDTNKDNSLPMELVEKTKLARQQNAKKLQGPVFPQAFARSLSRHFGLPVHWRSAGVDGGGKKFEMISLCVCFLSVSSDSPAVDVSPVINDIRRFCMNVLKEEVASEASKINQSCKYVSGKPDLVIVLFGINDLKHLLAESVLHPFNGSKDKGSDGGIIGKFRHEIDSLLNEIHTHAPNAIVLFPAMPCQSYHKNSVVNIFPLGMVWDAVLGFFLRQKKEVASKRVNCMHLDLTATEIANWYKANNEEDGLFFGSNFNGIKNSALLSADGVHPNKRMYTLWAESVCQSFSNCVAPKIEQAKKNE